MNDQRPDTAHAVSPDSGVHWAEPGAWPVAAGIHRIPLPLPMDGLKAVNVYALETDDGLTLIDAGWAVDVSRAVLDKSLAEIGAGVGDIRRFLVTHVHRDHYTQAVTIRSEVGAHVSLGLEERPNLEMIRGGGSGSDPFAGLFRAGGAERIALEWERFADVETPDLALWADPDSWLEGDTTLTVGARNLDAIHTPGHTQGHYVFADTAEGLLFSGDHVLPTITPSIGFEPALAEQPLGDFMASLARMRDLPDLRLLPAHGPVADSTHARVDELLDHHEERLALSLAAVDGGARSAYEVAGELPWTRHERRLPELDVFNAAMATMETRAHLELLRARGQVATYDVDGVVHYVSA